MVAGEHAYIADGGAGLAVVRVADPATPVLVGTLDTRGDARRIAVSGHLAVLAEGATGITVADITDPAAPFRLGGTDTPGDAMAVAFAPDADHIVVADYAAGLQVIDLSDPTSPVLAGTVDTQGYALEVTVAGHPAYVADHWRGVEVIDVSDPLAPAIVANIPAWGERSMGVAIQGDLAYIAEGEQPSGLVIVDIANPAAPVHLGSVSTPGVNGVDVEGDYAYLHAGPLVYVIDVRDPARPPAVGAAAGPAAGGVDAIGNRLHVAALGAGLRIVIVDTRSPESPLISRVPGGQGGAGSVATLGSLAFVWVSSAYGDGLFQVIDISTPSAPVRRGWLYFDSLLDILATENRAYVLPWRRLAIIDVTNPVGPVLLSDTPLPAAGHGVAVSGFHAFVATDVSALTALDVSDAAGSVVIASLPLPGQAWDVALAGPVAVVVNRAAGLFTVDVADPSAMSILGGVDTPGDAQGVRVAGARAYVADGATGLVVVDLTDPRAPVIVGQADTPGVAHDLTVTGGFAYVADSGARFQVIDIANPRAPRLLGGTYPGFGQTINHGTSAPVSAVQVAVTGEVVCVAAGLGGFRVHPLQCDIATPVFAVTGLTAVADDGGIALRCRVQERLASLAVLRAAAAEGAAFALLPDAPGPPRLTGEWEYLDAGVDPGVTYGIVKGDWPVTLGSPIGTDSRPDMILDEARIWNRVRTSTEIFAAHARALTPGEIADSSLVAYWPLDEGSGQVAHDATGHGHDLTLGPTRRPEPEDPSWTGPLPWIPAPPESGAARSAR